MFLKFFVSLLTFVLSVFFWFSKSFLNLDPQKRCLKSGEALCSDIVSNGLQGTELWPFKGKLALSFGPWRSTPYSLRFSGLRGAKRFISKSSGPQMLCFTRSGEMHVRFLEENKGFRDSGLLIYFVLQGLGS